MTVKTVIFVLLFTETSFIYPIFVHVLFRVLYPEKRMKRESGESPEQSRCCEFHARCIILVPLFFGKNGKAMYRERVRRPAACRSTNMHPAENGAQQTVADTGIRHVSPYQPQSFESR